ncbi:hypothetical protein V8G54_006848 [Vigna mungo]|uniref:Uncharacterized protein n=1 Tax=Vigna mungo TaxID=3915 RepID=A0AAQ3NZT3_VIGMU
MLDKSIREIERERQGLQTQEKKLILEIKKSAKQGQMEQQDALMHATALLNPNWHSAVQELSAPFANSTWTSIPLDEEAAWSSLQDLKQLKALLLPKPYLALNRPDLRADLGCSLMLRPNVIAFQTLQLRWVVQGAVRVMAKDLVRTRHQIEKFYKLKSQLQGVSLRIQTLKSTQAMGEAMKGVTKAMGQMNRQMNLPSLQKIMQEFERQNEKMELTSEMMGDAIDDALEGEEDEEETEDLVNQVLDEIGIDINQELVNAPSSAVAAPAAKTKVAQVETSGNDDGGIDSDLQARLDNLRKM